MLCVTSLKEITDGEKIGEIYLKGSYFREGNSIIILKGEICDCENKEIFNHVIDEGIQIVQNMRGVFFVIYYNEISRKIYIANDKLGREPLFYYYDEKYFILSDDFWEIVNLIEPKADDIDKQSVKELAVFWYPLFFKTIIKNLNYFPPASVGEFSIPKHKFDIKEYWDFQYKTDTSLTIDEAVNRLDRAFDNAMKEIKKKNAPNAIYGVGLSGGLDSRLIPYYALKNKMKLKSFIVGEKRPHKFVLSRDHKSARKLAKYYNIEHHEIEYDSEPFFDKSFYDIRHFPMGTSEFFKTVRKKVPGFDVLLNGATGGIIIGNLPGNLLKLSKDELVELLVNYYSRINPRPSVMKKTFKMIFGIARNRKVVKRYIDGVINKDEFNLAINKIRQFVEDNQHNSNIEIFQKYLITHVATKANYGAFESLQGWKKSYSIYYPYTLEEILSWKDDFLPERGIMEYFIISKFPYLAKIEEQNYKPAPFFRDKKLKILRKILSFVLFTIRGKGVMLYTQWAWKKKYKEYSRKILLKRNTIFNSIFNVNKILKMDKGNMILYDNLVKIKQLLDLIETKEYKKYF